MLHLDISLNIGMVSFIGLKQNLLNVIYNNIVTLY